LENHQKKEVIMFAERIRRKSLSLTFKVGIAFLTILFIVGLGPSLLKLDSGQALARNLCRQTAMAAFNACRSEATDDSWIARGNCNNLADRAARAACVQGAMVALREAKADCRDQLQARRSICEGLGPAPYDPQLDPANFVNPADIGGAVAANPYFPLIQGTVWEYQSVLAGETIVVTVTDQIKMIEYPEGSMSFFPCRVVTDVVSQAGETIEDTEDWFAQDNAGNVWYFGEISQEFQDGELVSLEGSWKAGRDGAKPGVIMLANPQPGDLYREEFFLGDAEDVAEIIGLVDGITVPFNPAGYNNVLQTKNLSPLEPGFHELKYYAPNAGLILEEAFENDIATGERVELVNMIAP
jgi:hypothetical protein